jgi:hypothetical protein
LPSSFLSPSLCHYSFHLSVSPALGSRSNPSHRSVLLVCSSHPATSAPRTLNLLISKHRRCYCSCLARTSHPFSIHFRRRYVPPKRPYSRAGTLFCIYGHKVDTGPLAM